MNETELREEVAKRTWFHRIRLPYGIVTPGTREADAWEAYKLPERLDGKTVLDIGAWEGGFSFEAERRGAKHVLAMDLWDNPTNDPGSIGEGRDNFQFAHKVLKSNVLPVERSVYDLPLSFEGHIDVVLFLEVLYHLHDPLRALRGIHKCLAPGGVCYLETWVDAEWIDEPAMIFYPGRELNGDPTNWWGPNIKCVQSMAVAAGFSYCDLVWSKNDIHLGGRGKRACFHLR